MAATSLGRRGQVTDRADATLAVPLDDHPATPVLAMAAVVAVGLDLSLVQGLSSGAVVAFVLAPLCLPALQRYASARLFLVLVALASVWGVVLSELASADHSVDPNNRIRSLALLVSGAAAVVVLLWAREHLPLPRIVALYGAGALLGAIGTGHVSWKYDLAVPTILLALGLIERTPRRWPAVAALLVLGVLGALDEGRSLFGLCLLAALVTAWQIPGRSRDRQSNRWFPALLVAGITVAIYTLATALLTGGYLGSTLEERSTTQIETTGSLIAGGRPEWSATRALLSMRPEGFGVGVIPSWGDYIAGKSGLASINVDTGGYAKHYMFGGQFRLHSVAADLWVSYGWAGVAVAVVIIAVVVRGLSFTVAARRAPPSAVFMGALGLWYTFFGPIYTNWIHVCVAFAFVVLAVRALDDPLPAVPDPAGRG